MFLLFVGNKFFVEVYSHYLAADEGQFVPNLELGKCECKKGKGSSNQKLRKNQNCYDFFIVFDNICGGINWNTISARVMSEKMSEKITEKITERTIERELSKLKKDGVLSRVGGRRNGEWIINE